MFCENYLTVTKSKINARERVINNIGWFINNLFLTVVVRLSISQLGEFAISFFPQL